MGDAAEVVELELTGHLTGSALDDALGRITERVASSRRSALLVDCRTMTGYEAAARTRFVDWHRTHHGRLTKTAIVTKNALWHMVIMAMGFASQHPMRPFGDPAAARNWLTDAAADAEAA